MTTVGGALVGSASASASYINPLTERVQTSGTSNDETSITLRTGVRQFKITNRGIYPVKLSYTATESGTQYATLFPNAPYPEMEIGTPSLTIYVQSPGESQPLEIISWL